MDVYRRLRMAPDQRKFTHLLIERLLGGLALRHELRRTYELVEYLCPGIHISRPLRAESEYQCRALRINLALVVRAANLRP